MPKIDNEQFYTSAIKKFGITAKGVNWASKKNQQLRFKQLLKLLPTNINSFSLADAGCGFGDFYFFLEKKKSLPKEYIGLDIHQDMCSIARQNTAQEILEIDIIKETLPVCDYYVCSGALNVLTTFETHLFIQNCFKASKKGFVFNALYGEKESETYNYLSKEKIKEIAKGLGVKEILLEDGYMENDMTVGFIK